jgi:cyclase
MMRIRRFLSTPRHKGHKAAEGRLRLGAVTPRFRTFSPVPLCVLCVFVLTQNASPQGTPAPAIGLTRLEVKPNLHVVVGGGSNSAFLVTDAGVLLIGAKESERAGQELREVIAGVTRQPVRYLILPNHQARSTHGATAFPQAVTVVAHDQAKRYMEMPPEAEYWTGLAAPSLPDLTFSQRLTLYLGGTRVQILHPGRGHSNADLMVLLPDQRVAYTGDLFWNRRLPFVDRNHGGSAQGILATMQRLLAMPQMETLIPGYGDVGTRADLRSQYTLLRDLQGKVRGAIGRGRTRAQTIQDLPIPPVLRSDPLERYEALLGVMYDELSRRPPRGPARPPARRPGASR